MKTLRFALSVILISLLCIGVVSAKETVVYQNDFSNSDLSEFEMTGTMKVSDGALKAVGSGTSAFISYQFPEEYHGKDYIVEVDYLGADNMGGLMIGATSDSLSKAPSYFSGYTCTTGVASKDVDGNKLTTYIAYFSESGWGGRFAGGTNTFKNTDVHLWVRVQKGVMTFRATSLEDGSLVNGFRYEIGSAEQDIYDTFTSTVGIRQYYADAGCFDNFKITILEDDVIPVLPQSVTLGGTSFKANGLTASGTTVSGSGAMISTEAKTGNYRVSFSLANKGTSRLYFGMKDEKNGYALEFIEDENMLALYKITDGYFAALAEEKHLVREGYTPVILDVHDGIVSLYYDNYFEGDEAFPKYEFYLDGLDGKFGFWLNGGSIDNLVVGGSATVVYEETYINPVNPGADPDVLYHDGTYYLYVYAENNGSDIFRVYTSPDLVHFTPRNIVFQWKHDVYTNVEGGTSWSPNVFYHDGLFYLFFAAVPYDNPDVRHVYYASSDSPYGPFEHDGPLVAINPGVNEIDGHPFVGYDGKLYMSFSRYDLAGTIWLEEVTMKDGVVTAKPETATRVAIPDMEWDNDGIGRLCEGGFVWKHDGYYYMIYATGSYARHYGEAWAVSKNPLGPYVKYENNPFINYNFELDGPGDALITTSPDGEELYLVYHRHYAVGTVHLRQTCVDLLKFVDNPDDPNGPDLISTVAPSSTPQRLPSNKYRYDINRDGKTTLADALLIIQHMNSVSEYSGYYDVDANGSIGLSDVMALLDKIK